MPSRAAQLASLGVDGLTRLLRERSDATQVPVPRTLSELAERLDNPISAARAVAQLRLPLLQVLLAAVALGDPIDAASVGRLVGADVADQLADLTALGLLARTDEYALALVPGARHSIPDLLSLGPSFAQVADAFPHQILQRAARGLGLPAATSKRATVAALRARYADAEAVRAALAAVPPELADGLVALAWNGEDDEDFRYDPERWSFDHAVSEIGLAAGLLLGSGGTWGEALMPAEVALALRGADYRVAFDPHPPAVATLPVARVEADAAVAVAGFDSAATAVLDHLAHHPAAALKSGGLGARELTRIAKAVRLPIATVRTVLELAAALDLVGADATVRTTGAFAAWRESEPSERYLVLAQAWWDFPGRPSRERDDRGTARPALHGETCRRCRDSLPVLFGVLRADAGLSLDSAIALAGWTQPAVDSGDPPFADAWEEALLLGAIAQGALTPIRAALLAGDEVALRAAVTPALPASATTATFGSDLTAVVTGSPSARVSGVLDACADRESAGGAVTWRLSRASVRRAIDDGRTVDGLRTELGAIAARELPQAVHVLLDDVARMYGSVSVRAASSVLVGRDDAEAALLLGDRKLAALGLAQVAPTVLVAAVPAADVVAALRKAGYFPAWDAPATDSSAAPITQAVRVTAARPADPAALAAELLRAGNAEPTRTRSERELQIACAGLSGDEVHLLAAALDTDSPVEIVYESATGGITHRAITPHTILYGSLLAWCHLRRGEREFRIERILRVRPAG